MILSSKIISLLNYLNKTRTYIISLNYYTNKTWMSVINYNSTSLREKAHLSETLYTSPSSETR